MVQPNEKTAFDANFPAAKDRFANRYQVIRPLGSGDRKQTYLATDIKMDRLVALSIVSPQAIETDPEGTEREVRILGHIGTHANIVSLYDFAFDESSGLQYMISEYLSGGTLAEYLEKEGPLPLAMLLKFGRQICRGISHIHSKGIIHRDISPSNIWLDERSTAHLGDFDSAIYQDEQGTLRPLTTNSFACPEELSQGNLDTSADLYSLGCMFYVLATGENKPDQYSLAKEKLKTFPTAFSDLILALVAQLPEDRPKDAVKVLDTLEMVRYITNIDSVIAQGENEGVEFKSSLIHPWGETPKHFEERIASGKVTKEELVNEIKKELVREVTQAIAGFMNKNGGTLIIGIDDQGNTTGIEADYDHLKSKEKRDEDGWQLFLKQEIENNLGKQAMNSLQIELTLRDNHKIAVVKCPPRPTYTLHKGRTKNDQPEFYVRTGNATQKLGISDMLTYVHEHFE